MTLDRRTFIAGSSLALPLLGACEPVSHGGMLTACDVHRDGYPTVQAVKWLGEALKKQSNGRMSIRSYPSGQLGGEDDTIALAQSGVIDICRVNSAALNNAFPLTQALSMPFVIENEAHLHRVLDGPIGQQILSAFQARGLIGLAMYDAGQRCLYNTHRPITHPRDMHGLKIRVPMSDVFIDSIGAMGANPTPLSVGAVYSSLQSRLIDGAENNWPTFETSRHVEVARFWSQTQHSYSPEFLLMSKHAYDRLAPIDQTLIRDLAAQSVGVMRAAWVKTEAESKQKAIAEGTQIVEVDKPAFIKSCEAITKARLANEDVAKVYAAIRALV
jgi:tripartite ATP-independent transporter DctP family solute receptor